MPHTFNKVLSHVQTRTSYRIMYISLEMMLRHWSGFMNVPDADEKPQIAACRHVIILLSMPNDGLLEHSAIHSILDQISVLAPVWSTGSDATGYGIYPSNLFTNGMRYNRTIQAFQRRKVLLSSATDVLSKPRSAMMVPKPMLEA